MTATMNISSKSYDSLLPFLVVEAITSQNSSFQTMSVQMMAQGWAWLVSDRRLLIWKFKEQTIATRSRRTLSPSFELPLPQSDLIHKADLINVFFAPQNLNTSSRTITVPAALAVSPEGIVRFWSSVANERYTESPVTDMQGQEFSIVHSLSPTEYLLGTTTGSVYSLKIDQHKGIICSSLTNQSGLLSGISRRMTNLFFGPMATDTKSEFRRPLFATASSTERSFFVLEFSFKLRQWCNSQSQVIREWDLQKKLQKKLCSALGLTDPDQLQFWPVDMVSTRSKELLILVSTLNAARNNVVNHATVVFNPFQAGDRISKTTILKSHSWIYSNDSYEQLFALKFVERCASSPVCFIYDRKFLFLAQVDRDILDAVDYANQDDGILGAGFIDNQVMLFTQRDGLVSCTAVKRQQEGDENNMTMNNTTLNSTRPFVSETLNDDSQMTTTLDATETSENHRSRADEADITCVKDTKQAQPTVATTKALNQSTKDNSATELDFTTSREFEWIQHIDNRRYGLASECLAKLVNDSELLQDRKETLMALSKLARLAE